MPVDRYLFGDWEPDRPAHWLGEDGVRLPTNMVPFGRSWRRQPKVHPFHNNDGLPGSNIAGPDFAHELVRIGGARTFTGIDSSVNGMFFGGRNSVGNFIYRLSQPVIGAGFLADVSRVAPYAFGNIWWDFAGFGNRVIATDGLNPVQSFATGSVNFIDLITSVDKPRAYYCATIGSHLVLARLTQPVDNLNSVKWWCSERDNANLFNQTAAGRSIFGYIRPGGGAISGIKGWEDFGIIFREQSAYLMERVSGGTYFTLHQIAAANAGTIDPASVVQVGNDVYYWSRGGFARIIEGRQFEPLPMGTGLRGLPYLRLPEYRDGDTSAAEINNTQPKIYGAYDPHWNAVCWLFMDNNPALAVATRRLPYNLFVYQIDSGRWGYVNPLSMIDPAGSPAAEIIGIASWPVGQQAAQPLDGLAFIFANVAEEGGVGSTVNHFWIDGVTLQRYVGGATYKISRMESFFWHRADQSIKIRRIRPIYAWASAGNVADPTLVPTLEMEVRMEPRWHRPRAAPDEAASSFVAGNTIPLDPAQATNGWYQSGLPAEGTYFAFRFSVPTGAGGYNEVTAVQDPIMVDIVGLEIDWAPSSKQG